MPDTRAAEAVDHGRKIQVAMRLGVEKSPAGACGQFKLFGSALADTLGITISPNHWGKNGLVTLIDEIADGLTNQVVGNSERREPGISQNAPAFLAVIGRFGSLVDVKMVAPTGELQSVEAHLFGERRKFCERKIGPLAGEESYRSGHSYMQQNSPQHDKYKKHSFHSASAGRTRDRGIRATCFLGEKRPKFEAIVLYECGCAVSL